MQVMEKTYLNYINLLRLNNWSVPGLLDSTLNYSHEFLLSRIGDFLIKSRNVISIDDNKIYKRVTVRINNNGVVLRDTEKGKNIGTKKQYLAKSGQFIVSKIDARNGAFGIIPEDLNDAIVTNDFPIYNVDTTKINPQFLLLITTTRQFIEFAQSCSSGTTNRQRMDIDLFLNQKVPLPFLHEQETILKNYYTKINQAEKLNRQADGLETEIELYFLEQLGIRQNITSTFSKGLRIIEYKNLDRWDANTVSELTSAYKIEKIGSYILKIATGTTPPTNRPEYFNGEINFYTPSDLGEIMFLNAASRKVSELSFLEKKARRFEKGTILFVGIGSTVGKVGIINNDYATSNQQITGFNLDPRFLLNEYVYFYFYYLRDITIKEQTKATLPIVNQNKIINIPIPIPPISKQKDIIEKISKMKNKKWVFESEARKLVNEAHQEFEQTIFR